MGEGKGSTLVHLLVIVLSLTAFGFAIAAERRRSTVNGANLGCGPRRTDVVLEFFQEIKNVYTYSYRLLYNDAAGVLYEVTNRTYCIYNSDVATGYGVGGFLFLLSSESLLMSVTKCMCFGRPLSPGGNRAWTIIYFVSSWMTFLVAEACLIAGARKNAYHTKYRNMIYADNFSCESLRKGIFIAGAVFVVATMILNIYYYMYFTKATTQTARKTNIRASSSVGMTGNV